MSFRQLFDAFRGIEAPQSNDELAHGDIAEAVGLGIREMKDLVVVTSARSQLHAYAIQQQNLAQNHYYAMQQAARTFNTQIANSFHSFPVTISIEEKKYLELLADLNDLREENTHLRRLLEGGKIGDIIER